MTPRRHRPDVHVGIQRVFLHPNPITEERSTGEGRTRIHRQYADPLATRPSARTREVAVVDLPTPGAPVRPIT